MWADFHGFSPFFSKAGGKGSHPWVSLPAFDDPVDRDTMVFFCSGVFEQKDPWAPEIL
jgi:hypothetical protein